MGVMVRLKGLLSVFGVAAFGCAAAPAPVNAADAVTIGILRLASSGAAFLAEDSGAFAAEGLKVEFKFFDAAQPIAVAVVSGDADIGITAFTAGFFNLAGKGALKLIAAQSREEPGYRLGAYLATPKAFEAGLTGPEKYAGKRLAITQRGSSFHYQTGLLADKFGFDMASVELVPLQSIPNMIAAFKGGQVDGMMLPGTAALSLIASGEAKSIGWVGDVTPWQLGGVFTSPKLIAGNRALVERVVRALQKGSRLYYDAFLTKDASGAVVGGPTKAQMIAPIARYTGQPAEQLLTAMPFIDPDGRLLVKDVYRQVAWYQSQGQVDKGFDAGAFLDASFVVGHSLGTN
jgi:NitT/TauT family transport system substrate-binding protein